MNCKDIEFGSYGCVYNIITPFKTGFNNEIKYVSNVNMGEKK